MEITNTNHNFGQKERQVAWLEKPLPITRAFDDYIIPPKYPTKPTKLPKSIEKIVSRPLKMVKRGPLLFTIIEDYRPKLINYNN